MRVSLVSAAFSIALTSCDPGPGTFLGGEALTGFVNDTRTESEVVHDVVFAFDDLELNVQDCPLLPAGSVTFDGKVDEDEAGGILSGLLISDECLAITLGYSMETTEPRDGRLDIVHPEGTVSYVGKNLVAERRFVPTNGLTAGVGGELRFRYEPSSDITSRPMAWLRTDPEDISFELLASKDNGDIVVFFPRDTPTGQHTLNIRFDLEIPTVVCEGFSSCAITGQHFEQVLITVQ